MERLMGILSLASLWKESKTVSQCVPRDLLVTLCLVRKSKLWVDDVARVPVLLLSKL